MLESEGRVTRLEGGFACVEIDGERGGCGRCHEAGGCRSGMLGQLFAPGKRHFMLANRVGAATGERVVVGVAEGTTLKAAGMAYGVPLVLLLAGAALGSAAGGGDAGAASGALAGLACGFGLNYVLQRTGHGRWCEPVLLRKA